MRYIIKRVGQEPTFVETNDVTPWSALCSKSHLGSEYGYCDTRPIGITKDKKAIIYVMFDDNGYFLREKLGYNCNIPSETTAFENKLYGDILFLRASRTGEGETLDIEDEDMELILNTIFTSKSEEN
ncbi:MAG: hypothetical protein K6E21_03595 [Bacilli bacterium]|nr:hypothetical protein [Bacilli bacterium]